MRCIWCMCGKPSRRHWFVRCRPRHSSSRWWDVVRGIAHHDGGMSSEALLITTVGCRPRHSSSRWWDVVRGIAHHDGEMSSEALLITTVRCRPRHCSSRWWDVVRGIAHRDGGHIAPVNVHAAHCRETAQPPRHRIRGVIKACLVLSVTRTLRAA